MKGESLSASLTVARPRSLPNLAVVGQSEMVPFLAATIGYSLYYVCRLSFSVVKGPLIDEGLLTEIQLGIIGSALFYSYAVGKLVNGFLADRVDIRRFASIGLFISAGVNLVLGFHVGFLLFFALWLVNGWCQSMGAGSFVVGLTRLFPARTRGTYYGIWSASHNIGEGLTFVVTAIAVGHLGWRYGWWLSGLLGLGGALLIWLFFRTGAGPAAPLPEEAALPDAAEARKARARLLRNPTVWLIALASMLMYVSRYSVNSWGIFFLQNAKGYSIEQGSMIISVSSLCGVVGTVASGWLSDRFFRGNRGVPTVLAGVVNALAITLFLLAPPHLLALSIASMVLFGISIGALICYLGGLMAVDIAGKGAAGAALGIVGMASYAGAGTQDLISGFLIGSYKSKVAGHYVYNFLPAGSFWVGSAALCVLASVAAWWTSRRGRAAS
jgi:OPA family sugar phosphate sensor protein UhpC-like MFS transporter